MIFLESIGSRACLSAINAENQQITKTPSFTPKNVKLGVFVLFKKTAEQYRIIATFFVIRLYEVILLLVIYGADLHFSVISRYIVAISSDAILNLDFSISMFCPVII